MRVALAQINLTVGDLQGNAELIISRAREAAAAGAGVVAFPELAICGYPPEDLLLKEHFVHRCRETLLDVAAACPDIVMFVGVPLQEDGAVYNAAAVLAGGEVVGRYRKIWLPNYAVFDEKRYFAPGDRVVVAQVGGVRLGVTICEDIWEEGGPGEAAASAGAATVVMNLSMSPYHVGKGHEREAMLAERARSGRAFMCYVNGVGGQDELVFDGQSLVFGPDGGLLARAAQFAEELLLVDIDPPTAQTSHETGPTRRDGSGVSDVPAPGGSGPWLMELINVETLLTAAPQENAGTSAAGAAEPLASRICEPLECEAEVYEALRLGVRDYCTKNGFKKVVMGISGGIDSALTACIAADALGIDKVNTVSMPSRYSSAGTKDDARDTAQRLGVQYHEIPIEGMYGSYLESLAPYLAEGAPGVTEQNIQARIRGNLLMALSNKFGWLVLTTGNKSETAVGYATLYGDMAGGFAVLKDVPKTLVYRLARYRNSLGPGAGPIPESTVERAPSAELAPNQTDQDTLPPYDVLDQIIEAYVVRDESVEEIVQQGLDETLVRRVVGMIDGNEYKRRQGAPGVRITPKAFGKDRRLPITNRYRG
ncbi:MAG: NAD+ synthase [Thermoleophilia bacterium]|nr:NAD+ synthase [Thermoleophilia bacterium]